MWHDARVLREVTAIVSIVEINLSSYIEENSQENGQDGGLRVRYAILYARIYVRIKKHLRHEAYSCEIWWNTHNFIIIITHACMIT